MLLYFNCSYLIWIKALHNFIFLGFLAIPWLTVLFQYYPGFLIYCLLSRFICLCFIDLSLIVHRGQAFIYHLSFSQSQRTDLTFSPLFTTCFMVLLNFYVLLFFCLKTISWHSTVRLISNYQLPLPLCYMFHVTPNQSPFPSSVLRISTCTLSF